MVLLSFIQCMKNQFFFFFKGRLGIGFFCSFLFVLDYGVFCS